MNFRSVSGLLCDKENTFISSYARFRPDALAETLAKNICPLSDDQKIKNPCNSVTTPLGCRTLQRTVDGMESGGKLLSVCKFADVTPQQTDGEKHGPYVDRCTVGSWHRMRKLRKVDNQQCYQCNARQQFVQVFQKDILQYPE